MHQTAAAKYDRVVFLTASIFEKLLAERNSDRRAILARAHVRAASLRTRLFLATLS